MLALVLCNAGFSFGAALQNPNERGLAAALKAGDKYVGELLRQRGRPGRFARSLQLLTVLLGFLVDGICLLPLTVLLAKTAFRNGLPATRAVLAVPVYGLATILFAAFGIVLPKQLTERGPERTARRALRLVHIFMAVLFVPERIVRNLVNVMLRLCSINPEENGENTTEEDVMSMVNKGHEQGVVESDEAKMIANIFRLNNKIAEDIMTQRKRVITLDAKMKLSDVVVSPLQENVHPRFPVYKEDINHIIGTLHLRDAISFVQTPSHHNKMLPEFPGLLRGTYFVPDTHAVDVLFREMQYWKLQMMIVVDEYGQMDGVISMEDILEEIVGNITDECDRDGKEVHALPNGSWIIHGFTRLSGAEETSGIPLTKEELEDFDTLNGFLIAKLDHFPKDNEGASIQAHDYLFQILKAESKMIKTVRAGQQED